MNHPLKERAIKLRRQGKSYTEIAICLKQPVSKSTLSYWCRGIVMTRNGEEQHKTRWMYLNHKAREAAVRVNRHNRLVYLQNLGLLNKPLQKILENKEVGKIALAMLYLGEGGKNRGLITFGNADPAVIKLFLYLLRKTYPLDEAKFRCTVQCRADQSLPPLESFWSKTCNIPRRQFYKAQIDPRTIGKKTNRPNYKGVCRIDYLSANVFNDVLSAINILLGR